MLCYLSQNRLDLIPVIENLNLIMCETYRNAEFYCMCLEQIPIYLYRCVQCD